MSAARCNGCGNEIVEIAMERGGSVFVLQSCSTCDRRRWSKAGESLSLNNVLAGITEAETGT
jgi:hypothetical protein